VWQENGLVFCHEDGSQYNAHSIWYRYGQITKKAGLGKKAPYAGRHTFASILFDSGTSGEKIADQMGHQDDRVTKTVYRHLIKPVLRDAADLIDAAYGG
jgi:integrase